MRKKSARKDAGADEGNPTSLREEIVRKRTILISVAFVMIWNVALAVVWQASFPRFPLLPQKSNIAVTQSKTQLATSLELVNSPSHILSSQLLDLFTLPNGWTLVGKSSGFSGSIMDARCPSLNTLTPAISRSVSFTHSGSSGGLAEVSIYSAGLGALALDKIRHQALSCQGIWQTGDVGVGAQSFSVNDNGGVYSSGPSGRTVWVRVGDIVTMVALRGYGIYSADNIAKSWVSSWQDTINTSACSNKDSTLSDAVRSPLSGNFKGWLLSQRVSLDGQELAFANTRGVGLVVNAATSMNSTNIAMPKEKIIDPTVQTLTTYPPNLLISYPSGRPTLSLSQPVFPLKPEGIIVSTHQPDLIGPGCGWALTGQEAPSFAYQEELKKAQALIAQNHVDLSNQWSNWMLERWRYGWLNDQYLSQLTAWNTWVASANSAIASAWWSDYDAKMISYSNALADYDIAYATWSATACSVPMSPTPTPVDSISPTPTPTPVDSSSPTPTPTPVPSFSNAETPTPTLSICVAPGEPVAPVKPIEPSVPRP
jgi:hypothetical protein